MTRHKLPVVGCLVLLEAGPVLYRRPCVVEYALSLRARLRCRSCLPKPQDWK